MASTGFDMLDQLKGARRFGARFALLVTGLVWFLTGAQITLGLFVAQEPPRFPVCTTPDCNPSVPIAPSDCVSAYRYLKPQISVVSTYNLPVAACETRPWKNVTAIHSSLFLGILVGAICIAPLSDKKGRRPLITFGVFGLMAASIYSTLAPTFHLYALARFLVGCSSSACALPSMALLSEITASHRRQWIVAVQAVAFCLAASYVAVLACVMPSWKILTLLITSPVFFFVIGIPCCGGVYVESPRWLAAKGRMEEAFGTWLRIARVCNVELDDKLDYDAFVKNELQAAHDRHLKSDSDVEEELSLMSVKQMVTPDSLIKAFRTFPSSVWMVVCIWLWMVTAFVYYGILLDFGDIVASLKTDITWADSPFIRLFHVPQQTQTLPHGANKRLLLDGIADSSDHPHGFSVNKAPLLDSHPLHHSRGLHLSSGSGDTADPNSELAPIISDPVSEPSSDKAEPGAEPGAEALDSERKDGRGSESLLARNEGRLSPEEKSAETKIESAKSAAEAIANLEGSKALREAQESSTDEVSASLAEAKDDALRKVEGRPLVAGHAATLGEEYHPLLSTLTSEETLTKHLTRMMAGELPLVRHSAHNGKAGADDPASSHTPDGAENGDGPGSAHDHDHDHDHDHVAALTDDGASPASNMTESSGSHMMFNLLKKPSALLENKRAQEYLGYLDDMGGFVKDKSQSFLEQAKQLPNEAGRLYNEMEMQHMLNDLYSDVSAQFTPDDPMAPFWASMRLQGLLVLASFLLEIPAYGIAMCMAAHPFFGRKRTVNTLLTLGGCCILAAFATQFIGLPSFALSSATLGLTIAGRSCIAAVFMILYIYCAEIFPTSIRGSSLGLLSACARIGCIVAAPLASYLDNLQTGLALLLFGTLSLSAAMVSVSTLPETYGQPLYDTLDTVEDMYTKNGFTEDFFVSWPNRLCGLLGRATCCFGRLISRCLGLPGDQRVSTFEEKGHAWLKKQWRRAGRSSRKHRSSKSKAPRDQTVFVPIGDDQERVHSRAFDMEDEPEFSEPRLNSTAV